MCTNAASSQLPHTVNGSAWGSACQGLLSIKVASFASPGKQQSKPVGNSTHVITIVQAKEYVVKDCLFSCSALFHIANEVCWHAGWSCTSLWAS